MKWAVLLQGVIGPNLARWHICHLANFNTPHAGTLIFGKTACVCELIQKKGAFWNSSRRRQSKNTTLAQLLQPPRGVFLFSRKNVFFGVFWPVFPIQITRTAPIICIGKNAKKHAFFVKNKKHPWEVEEGGPKWCFFDCRRREAFQKAPFPQMS